MPTVHGSMAALLPPAHLKRAVVKKFPRRPPEERKAETDEQRKREGQRQADGIIDTD